MVRRLCLVTGASSGIGAAFAGLYAARGYDLALTARRADRLEALAAELKGRHGVEAIALPGDLADAQTPARLMEAVASRGRTVDALVNNAGYGLAGRFTAAPWPDHQAFLQVMVTSPTALAHGLLPGMLARGFGRVINVASLLGLTPAIADHGLYSAAKAFVVRFSETLHLEALGTGVHITALCPGLTRSEFHADPALKAEAAGAPDWVWMDAAAVAEAGYAAVEANRPVCIPGGANRAMAALARAMPEDWALKIIARQSRSGPSRR